MNKFKKAMSLTVVSLVTLTSFVGCGNSSKSTSGNSGSPKNIEITYMDWEGQEMNAQMTEAIKEFETENPGVTVKQIPTPIGDYGLKLNQMVAANSAPDIFQAGHDMALQWSTKGQSYDFSKQAAADKDFTKGFYPGVYDLWVLNNKVIGLPGLLNTYGIFYNKDAFKNAGLTEPKAGWTWKEMFEDAQKLSSKNNGVQTYGVYNLPMDAFNVSVMGVSNGGQPFADKLQVPTKVTADSQFKAAVQTLQSYIKSGAIAPPSYDEKNINSAFSQGKVPMMGYGQWEADDLIRNAKGLNWGFAPTPKGDSQQSVIFDAVGWASPKGIKNPDMVWKLMKFMDSKMYESVLPKSPVAPTAYSASAQPYYDKLKSAGHQDVADSVDYILKTTNKQPVRFLTTWSGDASKFIDTDWNDILEGKKDISVIDTIVKNVNNVISSNK